MSARPACSRQEGDREKKRGGLSPPSFFLSFALFVFRSSPTTESLEQASLQPRSQALSPLPPLVVGREFEACVLTHCQSPMTSPGKLKLAQQATLLGSFSPNCSLIEVICRMNKLILRHSRAFN